MTTHVKFCPPFDYGGSSVEGRARVYEEIAEDATNTQTTITALQNEVAVVSSTVDINVAYGASPDATSTLMEMVTAGGRIQIPMNKDDKIAVTTV